MLDADLSLRLARPAEATAIATSSRDIVEYGLHWRWTPPLRPIGDWGLADNSFSGSRNAPSWPAYSTSPWKCAPATKAPRFSISASAIARWRSCRATTRAPRRRCAWAGTCLAGPRLTYLTERQIDRCKPPRQNLRAI